MSAPRITIAAITLIIAAIAAFVRPTPPAADAPEPVSLAEPAPVSAAPTPTASATAPPEQVRRARYRLHHDRRVDVAGERVDRLRIDGVWSRAPVPGSDRRTVRLTDARVEAAAEEARAAVDAPVQLVPRDGRLAGLGFTRETPPEARDVLTALATALWFSAGEGQRWAVIEEDQNGRYEATYTRIDTHTVRRARRYLALRAGAGWNTALADQITVTGQTTYHFDDEGLARLVVDERAVLALDGDTPWTVVELDITLDRLGFDAVAAHRAPGSTVAALKHNAEHSPVDIDRQRLDGRTVAELLADLPRVAGLPRGSDADAEARVRMLLQLESAARVEPGAVAAMAAAVAEGGHAINHTALVASALAQAGTAEATTALVDLMDAGLPIPHARHLTTATGLSRHPTEESLAALSEQVDDPTLGNSAALALGTSARTLGEGQAATEAVESLLDRYASAEDSERIRALRAVANTGSLQALPALETALTSGDRKLAEAAAFGLRFIEGAEADAVLRRLVTGSSPVSVRQEAVRALVHRDPLLWRPILEGALEAGAQGPLRQRIEQVLNRWS